MFSNKSGKPSMLSNKSSGPSKRPSSFEKRLIEFNRILSQSDFLEFITILSQSDF